MLYVKVWVEGTMALLSNRMADGALDGGGTRKNMPGEREDPRDVAEKGVYRLPAAKANTKGQLALPGAAIARMLREAGGAHKAKGSRKSLKYIIPAAVLVQDELCGLFLHDRKTPIHDFEVDSRPVVIPATKGRVMRHRARFNEWSCCVTMRINETLLDPAQVRTMLAEGIEQIGLGDFRPEKGGPFGVGSIVEWTVISDPKPKTSAQQRNGASTTARAEA